MHFLTPLAFALAALLPVIVALYFLKLRREEQIVSSVYLWQEMVRDVAANAPWQRLRPNWLLLLQLLVLITLIVALARPFTWTRSAGGEHLILVVDTSTSMAATDVAPNRLGAAADQARRLARNLPTDVSVTLIAAGDEVQVLLSASRDRQRLGRALDALRAGPGGADAATALELAAAIASGEPGAQIVFLSDGGVTLPERLDSAAELRYLPVGQTRENQAISALSLDPGPTAFVRVNNYGLRTVTRRLLLYAYSPPSVPPLGGDEGGEQLVTARDLTLLGGESVGLTLPDLPPETIALQARLEGQDALALDDEAWAVAPLVSGAQIQIVGPGNRFLEAALALLPGVEVTTISLKDYQDTWTTNEQTNQPTNQLPNQPTTQPTNWLTIFDGVLPEDGHYPPGALLFIAPLRSTEFFSVTGTLAAPLPRPASATEPLLQYVDLRDVVIQQATRLALPAWGRPVIVAGGDETGPLLVSGESDGRRLALLAFDLRQSDLPLRVAFPLLLANLIDFLAPGTRGGLPPTATPGRPLSIPLPPQAEAATVIRPDGSRARLPVENGEALFEDTDTPGVYEVLGETAGENWLVGRFAVNLFSPAEATIAPREQLALAGSGAQTIAASQPVRREWWRPLAWVALALLTAEWLVQYRGGLAWLSALLTTKTQRHQEQPYENKYLS
jgi:hypothetical protein